MPTFDTPRPIEIDVQLTAGSVHVIAGERDDTTVSLQPRDPNRQLDVETAHRAEVDLTGDRLAIRAPSPRRLGSYLGVGDTVPGTVELVIEVPTGSTLHVNAQIGDVRGDGTLGEVQATVGVGGLRFDRTGGLSIRTSGGDVTVRHVAGSARIRGAGDIGVGTVDGPAEVRNLNGPVRVGEVTGSLRVRSSSGDLVVDRSHDEVVAKTSSGDITIGEVRRGAVELRTAYGRVAVGVAAGTAVRIDAASKFGRITNELEDTDGPGGSDETAEVRAQTSYGDIVIHRS